MYSTIEFTLFHEDISANLKVKNILQPHQHNDAKHRRLTGSHSGSRSKCKMIGWSGQGLRSGILDISARFSTSATTSTSSYNSIYLQPIDRAIHNAFAFRTCSFNKMPEASFTPIASPSRICNYKPPSRRSLTKSSHPTAARSLVGSQCCLRGK